MYQESYPYGFYLQNQSLNQGQHSYILPSYPISKEANSNQQNKLKAGINVEKQLLKKETKQKTKRRIKDPTKLNKMGRPNNGILQDQHLGISKTFNDIIYHSSRMLLILMLKKGSQDCSHTLQLQNYQSIWMSNTDYIMNQQNFPQYHQQQNQSYILHPNSLHYVFQYMKTHEGRSEYNQQQVKYILFAFLIKNNILSSTIYHYVNDYWADIIYLVNNPDEDECEMQIHYKFSSEKHYNNQNFNRNNFSSNEKSSDNKNEKPRKKTKEQTSEMELLKQQLKEDDSVVAYQIACYLYACCVRFDIKIGPLL